MKLNELIEQLVEIQRKYTGDVPVISDEGFPTCKATLLKPSEYFLKGSEEGFSQSDFAVVIEFDY